MTPFEALNRKNNSTRKYIWWQLDSLRRRNCVFTDRLYLPLAKKRTENIALSLHEIDTLMFFNVPLQLYFYMRYRRKQKIPRALFRHFDPYVFTFNLETETVSTLIIFSAVNVSRELFISLPCGVVMTFSRQNVFPG